MLRTELQMSTCIECACTLKYASWQCVQLRTVVLQNVSRCASHLLINVHNCRTVPLYILTDQVLAILPLWHHLFCSYTLDL